jgi:hypothetical protein
METMMAGEAGPGPEIFERKVAAKLAAAECRLRYDKVALRLIAGLKAGIPQELPMHHGIIFAIAAPIKHPSKTISALTEILPTVPAGGLRTTVHGNKVHARRVARTSTDIPRVMGFVHNPDREADLILDLVEATLNDH